MIVKQLMYSLSACVYWRWWIRFETTTGGCVWNLKGSPHSTATLPPPPLPSLSLPLSFPSSLSLPLTQALSALEQLSHCGAAICTLLVITLSAPKAVRRHPPGIYSRHKPSVLITPDPRAIYTQLPLTHPWQHANVYVFGVCVCQ